MLNANDSNNKNIADLISNVIAIIKLILHLYLVCEKLFFGYTIKHDPAQWHNTSTKSIENIPYQLVIYRQINNCTAQMEEHFWHHKYEMVSLTPCATTTTTTTVIHHSAWWCFDSSENCRNRWQYQMWQLIFTVDYHLTCSAMSDFFFKSMTIINKDRIMLKIAKSAKQIDATKKRARKKTFTNTRTHMLN